MKPMQFNEKVTSPAASVQEEDGGKKPSRKMMYMLSGIVVFILVVSAVLLSVYFGIIMTKDNFKEYEATFQGDDGNWVNEKITVTDNEEIFDTPVATGVADFSTGLVTYKFQRTDMLLDECYVTNLNTSDFQTPKEFTRTHTSDQIIFSTDNKVMRKYEVTDIWLNNKALGPKSAGLCDGKTVFFLRELTEKGIREKRGKVEIRVRVGNVEVTITVSW